MSMAAVLLTANQSLKVDSGLLGRYLLFYYLLDMF